jgi:hypothetical protein
MNKLARKFAIALALLFVVGSTTAEAGRYAAKAKAKDGRSARGAVLKNYKAKGRSTNVRVTKTGLSKSGKSLQVLVATKGSGKVRAFNVRKGVAFQTRTQAKTQKAARKAANQKLRRQNGSYAGVNSSGLSKSGKSFKFNSATDRAAKTGDKAYVNVKTGKASKRIRGE